MLRDLLLLVACTGIAASSCSNVRLGEDVPVEDTATEDTERADAPAASDVGAAPDAPGDAARDASSEDVEPPLPIAVAACTRTGSGEPMSNSVLANGFESVTCSAAESERAVRYEWRIHSAPAGSSSAFDDPAEEAPTLALDLYGQYVLELVVYDAAGHRSDPSSNPRARVAIAPDWPEQFHAELVVAPVDGVEAPVGLDVHLVHENGCWLDPRWDCHADNPTPDWGTRGGRSYSPTSHSDDAPSVSVQMPFVDDVSYRVGLSWTSRGDAQAVLRVYARQALVFEGEVPGLETDGPGFWEAAEYDAETGAVRPIDEVTVFAPECR